MPKFVDHAQFDSNLFHLKVGRVELNEEDMSSLDKNPSLEDVLQQAHSSGYRLVYVFAPPRPANAAAHKAVLPGLLVDVKTTYSVSLFSFDYAALCQKAFRTPGIRIRKHVVGSGLSNGLKQLAIDSGVYSRFKVDKDVPNEGFEGMFGAWISNSVNRTLADEVFIAYESTDDACSEELGFISVRKVGNSVSIGLLAVSDKARRRGIAYALLSRAMIWALEELGGDDKATATVVTQGANAPACACYERFGFQKETVQEVYHTWLPKHLTSPMVPADQANPIPFCKQHFTGKELVYATQVINSGLDSAANFTMQCAAKIQELIGSDSERVIMVPSGTAALEMAALLCELQPGDEVILPSYTFSSTANCFVLRGVVPVFVDVKFADLNIDETLIEAAITEKTKAICCVHYAGIPCEMDTICEIAKKHNLFVIEDAAQGFLSTYKGRQLGTIGDFGCYSFHYTKNIICGEGGALSINRNRKMAGRAMVLWEKGTNRYDFMMGKIDKYHWIDLGSSYVPNELSCAVLWAQLEHVNDISARRRANFAVYMDGLQDIAAKGIMRIPVIPSDCQSNAHIFFMLFPTRDIRDHYSKELKRRGIAAFSHYVALHSAPAGIKYGRWVGDMHVTDEVQHTLLRLPVWVGMTAQEVQSVLDAVREIATSPNTPVA